LGAAEVAAPLSLLVQPVARARMTKHATTTFLNIIMLLEKREYRTNRRPHERGRRKKRTSDELPEKFG
jgi:hypothetical protein